MLKPRRANIDVMRMSAPGLFSTRTESVWVIPSSPLSLDFLFLLELDQVERGGAGRDHREALLLRVDAGVDDRRPRRPSTSASSSTSSSSSESTV